MGQGKTKQQIRDSQLGAFGGIICILIFCIIATIVNSIL